MKIFCEFHFLFYSITKKNTFYSFFESFHSLSKSEMCLVGRKNKNGNIKNIENIFNKNVTLDFSY